jgi:hypothetical protein
MGCPSKGVPPSFVHAMSPSTSPTREIRGAAAARASNGKSAREVDQADSHSVPSEPKTSPIVRLNRAAARVAAFRVGSKR